MNLASGLYYKSTQDAQPTLEDVDEILSDADALAVAVINYVDGCVGATGTLSELRDRADALLSKLIANHLHGDYGESDPMPGGVRKENA